jgi:hypothetical protein
MTILSAMNRLLKTPNASLEEANEQPGRHCFELLAGALLCFAAYAAAAGMFQGGASIALAILKIPLIVLASVALCVPSFYVFTALAGADYAPRQLAALLAGFCGVAGLLLLGLMPVTWVFSISSRSLAFVVWMHIVLWVMTVLAARHYLVRVTGKATATAIGCWIIIVFFVSLQMTTSLRPVLWRAPNQPLFTSTKLSFFEHLGRVWDWKEPKPETPKDVPKDAQKDAQKLSER